ncbi:MAG: bifunctional diaminohydroxyphosphoribosylaminopyrimidine deaminase/5-amino-6-(5-phosphoribosylamino)uracil reductase RibD [Thiotrichales bacterium]|nr:MAG: bifunctional diaminohydroxyphosphoribosylaminopyrimidine deaminase/5-amino-6-(5-phosphoribosylamino)uracil reductase RibD [Thiotrichales bacterium]
MDRRDTEYMQRALRLAGRGLYTTDPNPRVGCVIVRDDRIVGEGWHQRAGEPHAEILALQQAGDQAAGATVYVTLEPCSHHGKTPPCADALVNAGVARVVAALQDPNPEVAGSGFECLRKQGIEVDSGLLEHDARAINPGFIKRMECRRPYVRVKLAMSLDGRTAMASGESQWISGEAARADVQRLRARSSVILTGVDTVIDDDPSLTVRHTAEQLGIEGAVRQPHRVVLDTQLRMPANAKMLTLEGSTTVLTAAQRETALGCDVVRLDADDGRVDLNAVMNWLAEQEVNEVQVEAGATLCGALLQRELVDEIILYMAPHIMGNDARGLFNIPGLENMADRIRLEIMDIRSIGSDLRITAIPAGS